MIMHQYRFCATGTLLLLAVAALAAGCGSGTDAPKGSPPIGSAEAEFGWAAIEILPEPGLGVSGHLEVHTDIESDHIPGRRVHVWLPPSYGEQPDSRFPVLYMHDGQNVFDPAGSVFSGRDWAVDEVILALADSGAIRPPIVVAIESGPLRIVELAPQDVLTDYFPVDTLAEARRQLEAGVNIPASQPLLGNAYLAYITEDLMPWVEANYRVQDGPENTFIMGSSMGGLASIYALYKRPDVFGGAAALSTHWPVVGDYMLDWLRDRGPLSGTHRLYMDRGTETLDSQYGAWQHDVDRALGVADASNMTSHVFPGHAHTEADWRRRVHLPLQFLLGTERRAPPLRTVQ
ncbi:MAG: esterase [Bacteroidetes bacterium CG12_big_fil_rev_8_21_14_0_65_60_17]|nr:MAG: esterase [Bacteroidetes bacterium CG12_big_fil_rev_8_21_14_0_65_60_17]